MRIEFNKKTKLAIFRRASATGPAYPARRPGRVYCEHCECDVTGKAFHYDHVCPEWKLTDTERRALTAADGQLLCTPCHHEKTLVDMADKPHNDRLLKKRARIAGPKRAWPGMDKWVKPVGGGKPRRRA